MGSNLTTDPRLQIKRDPAFYAAAAKTRTSLFSPTTEFVYEDGLTVIERNQRETLPAFLTGSAKSQADKSTIRRVESDSLIFGLDPDRFQLLFIIWASCPSRKSFWDCYFLNLAIRSLMSM